MNIRSSTLAAPSSRPLARLQGAGVAALLLVAGCSGGGGSGGGGALASSMSISSCSLGCGSSGTTLACANQNVAVNQEIVIRFTRPVALSSLDKNTVQLVEVSSGKAPPYSLSIDPNQPRHVLVRPLLTFDSSGNPVFGLNDGSSYNLRVPGVQQDPEPYIRSVDGEPNQTRLACTIAATQGISDPVPGGPTVSTFVDVIDDSSGTPVVVPDQAANGAVDVASDTVVTFEFDDLMNPATLVNPISMTSQTIQVFVDLDGNTADPADQVEIFGAFTIDIDQGNLRTTVTFTPFLGLPSAGTGAQARKVVVRLPGSIRDLGGNPLVNAGSVVFTPQFVPFPPTTLPDGTGESFADEDNLDTLLSGGDMWGGSVSMGGESVEGGVLGLGGGSGHLGTLVVEGGTTVILDTDSQDFVDSELFPGEAVHTSSLNGNQQVVIDFSDTIDVTNVGDEADPLVVTGGVFELASLEVRPGGVLRFQGSNPGRLYVRGQCLIRGIVDLSGASATSHSSDSFTGSPGAAGGPSAGAGGRGADRPDNTGQATLLPLGGIVNPGAVIDGAPGEGILAVGGGPLLPAGGGAGMHHPTNFPTTKNGPEVDNSLCLLVSDPIGPGHVCFEGFTSPPCSCEQQGGQGGGGAFALDGKAGLWRAAGLFSQDQQGPFPATVGGDAGAVGLEPFDGPHTIRTLDPAQGFLRGGSGGGGGGASVAQTRTTGGPLTDCKSSLSPLFPLEITDYISHSAAGGGGGGGAIQIQSGSALSVEGIVDASGGDGGGFVGAVVGEFSRAAPGGGGSGGAVLFQAFQYAIVNVTNRIDVRGGTGGLGQNGIKGGDGGPGLVRFESDPGAAVPDPVGFANSVGPFDDDDGDKVGDPDSDDDDGDGDPFDEDELDLGGAASPRIVSVDHWQPSFVGPDGLSGFESCWLQPSGSFFLVDYEADDLSDPLNPDFGWDMDVIYDLAGPGGGPLVESYRDGTTAFGDTVANFCGTDLGSAPIVVRFQGARRVKELADPCVVDETDPEGPVLPESLTDWVRHPSELNGFWDFLGPSVAAQRKPNLIRFQIVFDRNDVCAAMVEGITNVRIEAQPD